MVLVILVLGLGACAEPGINVSNAWIRTPPPGRDMTAGYLELTNETAAPVTLIGAACDGFSSVTIHESRVIDGVWQMSPVNSLSVGPGEQISLRPGGLHLMMSAAHQPLRRGESTTIRLQFDNGRIVTFQAVVQDAAP